MRWLVSFFPNWSNWCFHLLVLSKNHVLKVRNVLDHPIRILKLKSKTKIKLRLMSTECLFYKRVYPILNTKFSITIVSWIRWRFCHFRRLFSLFCHFKIEVDSVCLTCRWPDLNREPLVSDRTLYQLSHNPVQAPICFPFIDLIRHMLHNLLKN